MRIVVIGGTGLIGSKVISLLVADGHDAVSASPRSGVDTLTGQGLADVLVGTDVVVDVSNSPSFEAEAVLAFFTRSTTNLLAAEAASGVGHHVALSVVGTSRLGESGYFRGKIAQEELIRAGEIPYSIVHATQFYEFAGSIADAATDGTTVRLSHAGIQPIAADDVASEVARVAVGSPVNGTTEIAGPERFGIDDFIRLAVSLSGDSREVITDREARYFDASLQQTTLLPADDAKRAATRYEDWFRKQ
jgi:uncharacterized protein YbjT (DUF2867 family)